MTDDRLVCPNHGDERSYLVEVRDDDSLAECPRCQYVCQNFLKYPVAEVWNRTDGTKYLKNMLTSEIVSDPVPQESPPI